MPGTGRQFKPMVRCPPGGWMRTSGVGYPEGATITLPANTWQQVTLTLAALGVANQPTMDGFWIQDRSGTAQPTFYLADIRLTATRAVSG